MEVSEDEFEGKIRSNIDCTHALWLQRATASCANGMRLAWGRIKTANGETPG